MEKSGLHSCKTELAHSSSSVLDYKGSGVYLDLFHLSDNEMQRYLKDSRILNGVSPVV